jgi:4'-phosphopantetheinyl transferase
VNALSDWPPAALSLACPPEQIHVWRVKLDGGPEQLPALGHALAPDELARADRFRFPHDRSRFVIAHAALRALLGRYLNRAPEQIRFASGPHGKPRLTESTLHFNLAHSGGLALIAVAWEREVGVDLEGMRADVDFAGLAARFFSPAEARALAGLPDEEQVAAFYAAWTRKEAYLKARGAGLSLGLAQCEVSFRPGEPAALLATQPDPAEAARWTLAALDPGPGYAGALAAEGAGWRIVSAAG